MANFLAQKATELMRTRRHAYLMTFRGPHGEAVLEDLAKFCRAAETTFNTDARTSALLEGRREVFLRINNYLQLNPKALVRLASSPIRLSSAHEDSEELD